jgi:glycosyltransferase involved in cell wall biosynthesis
MKPEVSVVIPTYNPRRDYLKRVLEALEAQTLDRSRWEVVVVDNASSEMGDGRWEMGKNLNARIVREDKLGLTHARRRGFRETTGEVVVMVDDDNVLSPNYLEEAGRILRERPKLGAIGGKCLPEFETEPEPWAREFLPLLALRDHGEKEIVSGEVRSADGSRRAYPDRAAPIGAGMVVRRPAADAWLAEESDLPDRRGAELSSAGDNDLVFQILRGGWEVGYFPRLVVTHLIPKERLTAKYLARANRGIQRSWVQVLRKHDACPWPEISGWGLPLRKAKAWAPSRGWTQRGRIEWHGRCGNFEGRVA